MPKREPRRSTPIYLQPPILTFFLTHNINPHKLTYQLIDNLPILIISISRLNELMSIHIIILIDTIGDNFLIRIQFSICLLIARVR